MVETRYIINGVNMGRASLNSMGWAIMRDGTSQLGGVTKELNRVKVPGYDGYFSAPSTRTEQVLVFNIRTPRAGLEALLAVLNHVGYDSNFPTLGMIEVSVASGKAAYFELVSAIPSSEDPNDATVDVTATLSIPYGGWRDKNTTESSHAIADNPTTVTGIATGLSLPIRDMDVFIQGDVGTMQINDSAGSWLRTTSDYVFSTGYGIFYQGSTGRAFQATNASPWTPTADLGFAVDVSGGGFKLTPKFDPTTPETRAAQLTVLSTLLTSVSIKLRLRGAYAMK